ncbi:glycosyltransferase family 4 protein [Clostridium prolinivorans]|uniref:glycosyltransferase family 4 protein n=1 Tax=Clostridium prolinivorans TaxID=2769420 RepID=UPI000FD93A65|nr:glycosyltransferase family 4 protein [Clostridium prolinivorans]
MKERIKILLISNMYPNKRYPNYGVFVKNTEKILKNSNFKVYKIVLTKQTNKIKKLIKYILFYFNIIFKGIFKKYDVIYVHYASHNAIPLIILKKIKKNIKIFVNVHGSDIVPETNFQQKLQLYTKTLLQNSDLIIVPSNYFKNLVNKDFNINFNKIFVYPSSGINKENFYKIEDKNLVCERLKLNPQYDYIGYVGRIDTKKGWNVFLEAMYLLKKQKFFNDKKIIVVGDGKELEKFNLKVIEYELQDEIIHFPLLPQEELIYIYNSLKIFCFPTMGESLGLVGIEAMACGIPVIGSNIGGLKDYIIDGYNGFFFEAGDSEMLKEKILKYFQLDENDKKIMIKNALNTSRMYEVNNIKNDLINIFINNV